MWINIFKAGTHTDSAGNTKTWTKDDLDNIISKYNDQEDHEAPIVIGHPKDNSPAFGWVEGLKRKGDKLFAKIKPTVDDFVDWVKRGLYKKISISLYSDNTLRHIGFLGAMPPAVKGLDPVKFNEKESVTIEYMDFDTAYRLNDVGRLFQGLREWFIEQFSIEKADEVLPSWDIEQLQKAKSNEATPSFADPTKSFQSKKGGDNMPTVEELQSQLTQKETEIQQFQTDKQALETQVQQLQQKIDDQKAREVRKDIEAFVEEQIKEGRLTPAEKDAQIELMLTLAGSEDLEFSEGDKTKKVSPLELHKEFIKKLPKRVEFGEFARNGGGVDMTDPQAIATKAQEYMDAQAKLGNTISIAEAVTHVTKGVK